MTGMALAVTLVGVVALGLAAVTFSLARQVRHLHGVVEALSRPQQRSTPEPSTPEPVQPEPVQPEKLRDDVAIRPTPLGPAEVEPDPSVTRVASVTLAGPLIKVAAFSHGVRRALAEESRMRVAHAFRRELRRQRRMRRKPAGSATGPPRKVGWRP